MAISNLDYVRSAYVLLNQAKFNSEADLRSARERLMLALQLWVDVDTSAPTAEDITAYDAEVIKRMYLKNTSGAAVVVSYGGKQLSVANNGVISVFQVVGGDILKKYPGKFVIAAQTDFETGTQGIYDTSFDS